MLLARRLGLDAEVIEQMFRRMVFNVVARNQDDHVKNISFLMDRGGTWSLAPAYDVTWAYAPGDPWLDSHQMTISGRRDGFTLEDLRAVALGAGLKRGRFAAIYEEVRETVAGWTELASEHGIPEEMVTRVAASHRLEPPPGRRSARSRPA